jgi:hypothetical protein
VLLAERNDEVPGLDIFAFDGISEKAIPVQPWTQCLARFPTPGVSLQLHGLGYRLWEDWLIE